MFTIELVPFWQSDLTARPVTSRNDRAPRRTMESVKQFIEASERRSALVARLRGMLEASVPFPPESPATPKSELNFAKGFPEPAEEEEEEEWDEWEHYYKELWNPEPDGDGTETNGAQIFVSLVDQADPSAHPQELDASDPAYLYSNWKFLLEQLKKGERPRPTFSNWVSMYHNANNYDKARPEGSEDPVPHLDKAMAEFNTALALMGASDENKYVSYAISTSTGAGSVFWHFKRALANLEDYGEEGGGASARYAAQKREMREAVEHRIAVCLERNEAAWQSFAQTARDAAEAAAASDETDEALASVWMDVEDCWTIAISAKNGLKENGAANEWDFSGPEGEECEKGIAEAVAKQKAARENAK